HHADREALRRRLQPRDVGGAHRLARGAQRPAIAPARAPRDRARRRRRRSSELPFARQRAEADRSALRGGTAARAPGGDGSGEGGDALLARRARPRARGGGGLDRRFGGGGAVAARARAARAAGAAGTRRRARMSDERAAVLLQKLADVPAPLDDARAAEER